MHEELKRCNYIGDINSVYALSQIAIVNYETNIESVNNICMLNPSLNIKPKAGILFFCEIGLIELNNGVICARKNGCDLIGKDISYFIRKTAELTLNYLLDNGLINVDAVSYDVKNLKCSIKKSAFPLSVAVFRNYLLDAGMMEDISGSIFILSDSYEQFFEDNIKLRKNTITLEQLKEKQIIQEMQGRKAEEYVVEFERKRLKDNPQYTMIRQISDFDVTAGFDIVSFESKNSETIDRFIEVKSFHTIPHFFWSANEVNVAKMKGKQYCLYLVDMDRYLNDDYEPIVLCDPANEALNGSEWIVSTASYELTKV